MSVVVIEAEELRAMIRAEVRAALAERRAGDPDPWLDANAVAELLGVHPRTVAKLSSREGLPAHRIGAKLLRYRRAEVFAWLEERSRKAGAHADRHRARLAAAVPLNKTPR